MPNPKMPQRPYKKQPSLGSTKAPTIAWLVQKLLPKDTLNHQRMGDVLRRKFVIAHLEKEVTRDTPIERIISSLTSLAETGEKRDLVNASTAFERLVELLKKWKEPDYKVNLAGNAMLTIVDLLEANGMHGKALLLGVAAEEARNWKTPE